MTSTDVQPDQNQHKPRPARLSWWSKLLIVVVAVAALLFAGSGDPALEVDHFAPFFEQVGLSQFLSQYFAKPAGGGMWRG